MACRFENETKKFFDQKKMETVKSWTWEKTPCEKFRKTNNNLRGFFFTFYAVFTVLFLLFTIFYLFAAKYVKSSFKKNY